MDIYAADIAKKLFARADDDKSDADECGAPKTTFPKAMPIGMMYVPFQKWETPYETDLAISRGTIFPSLDLPFIGKEAARNGSL